jgi:hypothetical protein
MYEMAPSETALLLWYISEAVKGREGGDMRVVIGATERDIQ